MKRYLAYAILIAAIGGQAHGQAVPDAPAPLPAPPSAVGTPAAALPPAPAVAPAPPAVPAAPGGPVITIDPRGFTGGTGAGVFSGLGTVIVDPLSGGASAQPALPQTSAGTDAALRASTPTSLDPAPTGDAYPFCRNPNDQRCRARPGTRVAQ